MPYNFVVSVHISFFFKICCSCKNLYCNLTDASLWGVRRNRDKLYYTILSITPHHYTILSSVGSTCCLTYTNTTCNYSKDPRIRT